MQNRAFVFLKWQLVVASSVFAMAPTFAQVDQLDSAAAVTGRYIVVLKAGADRTAVAKRHAVLANRFYTRVLNGFAGFVPPGRLAALERDSDVAWVEPDQVATIVAKNKPPADPPPQTIPTGISRIGLSVTDASGVGIAIIDTGIDLDHPDLNVVGDVTFVSRTTSGEDDNGHGTHCAGIAAALDNDIGVRGVAPGARLFAVKVLSRSGRGLYSDIIAGVDWVADKADENGIEVANMSLGGSFSLSLNLAVANAVQAGVVFCVAAGNESQDVREVSPASCVEAITVSAINDADGLCGGDTFASFSNYGELVDIAAPGVNIYSTYKGGGYATMSGTSMASPHAAGAAAVYISYCFNPPTPAEVQADLIGEGWAQTDVCGFIGDNDGFYEPMLRVVW